MREDMAKVIVERPRILDDRPRKGRGLDEDLPAKIGMRRHQRMRGGHKTLNENLAPLRRFLEKQVGRRWDDVYSEIAKNLRADNTVQQHVRDHVRDFVEFSRLEIWMTVILPNGSIERRLRPSWQILYVDPDDGILKRNPLRLGWKAQRRKAARAAAVRDTVRVSAMRDLKLIDGIWYEVDYAVLPDAIYVERSQIRRVQTKPWHANSPGAEYEMKLRCLISRPVYDVLLRAEVAVGPSIDENGSLAAWRRKNPRYAASKRQACGRTLRRYGLANGTSTDGGAVLRTG